jgi:hypothetical protein
MPASIRDRDDIPRIYEPRIMKLVGKVWCHAGWGSLEERMTLVRGCVFSKVSGDSASIID